MRTSIVHPQWHILSKLGFSALRHHALNLSIEAPDWFLPVMITVLFSSQINAFFYMASMVAGFVFAAPNALAASLYAVGAQGPSVLAQKTRLVLKLSVAAGVLGNVVLQFTAGYILNLFGAEYGEQATACLRILALGVFPITITAHYLTICRIQGRFTQATKMVAASGLLRLALAPLGTTLAGLTGLAVGWLLALCIGAVFMVPTVYRVASSGQAEIAQVNVAEVE